jgi:diguanylate cyclase (GGDEF)-like protein
VNLALQHPTGMRLSPESRMIAAFVAAAFALIAVAWLAISNGREYVDAQERLERSAYPEVPSELSSTTGAAARPFDPAAVTNRVSAPRTDVRAERDSARHHLDAVERASALLGVLTITFFCLAYAGLLRTLREQRRLRDIVAAEANHDFPTGLPNRRFFAEWLAYAIAHARRADAHIGVLFIDIAGGATVSTLHGERAVDSMMVEIARRFRATSREGDLFARLGATEFALATPNACDGRELALLAQRLRDELNDPAQPPLADTPIGASIGLAFFPEDAEDSAGVMAAANAAMYAARRAGKNHVAFNGIAA